MPAAPEVGLPADGYLAAVDDPRIVKQYAVREAIATSSGQADAGMFELNFRDDRYLPFEFAGAVSRWRIELPPQNNYFEMDTLSDVVLHLNYTAREGGKVLADAASSSARRRLPDAGRRAFDVRREFPDAWRRLEHELRSDAENARLELSLDRNLFAFIPGQRAVRVTRLELLLDTDSHGHGLVPIGHHLISLSTPPPRGCKHEHEPCIARTFECVSSAAWQGFFHGGIDVDVGPLRGDDGSAVAFCLPKEVGSLRRLFVMCEYETVEHDHQGFGGHWHGHVSAPAAKAW